jgi:NMD protein affecting ribosome stability and mRNA decay
MENHSLSKICIECGEEDVFFQHLCKSCFLESNPIIKSKKELSLVACLRCGLLSISGQWTKFYLNDLGSANIHAKLSNLIFQGWEFYYRPKKLEIQSIEHVFNEDENLKAEIGKIDISASPDAFVPLITISEDFIINVDWGDCTDCRTRLDGTYTSKIQIRSPHEIPPIRLETWGEEIELLSKEFSLSDGKSPLFKLINIKNGLDALYTSKTAANSVGRTFAKNNGGIVSVTTEFAGFDKSKSKEYPRKQIVVVTLPKFQVGDLIVLNKQVFRLKGFSNLKVSAWDIKKSVLKKFNVKQFNELDFNLLISEFEEYQIINFELNERIVQIMNLSTYDNQYVDLGELKGLSEGETFWGMIYDGSIILKTPDYYDSEVK